MNIGDYKFEDYVNAKKNDLDIHPSISDVNTRLHSTNKRPNMVYYGPEGSGNTRVRWTTSPSTVQAVLVMRSG